MSKRWWRLIALALPLGGCGGGSQALVTPSPVETRQSKPLLAPSDLRELSAGEKRVLASILAESLKDPGSAQWKWAKFPKAVFNGETSYCAQVNAKNSYGGYNGFKVFLAVVTVEKGQIKRGAIAGIQDTNPTYAEIVPNMCREEGLDPFA